MKPDLSLGKDLPTIMEKQSDSYVVNTKSVEQPSATRRAWSTKHVAILAVAMVLVVAIVAGALLGAMHMMRESHEYAIKAYQLRGNDGKGQEITENVEVNVEKETTKTTTNYENKEFTMIEDFKRGVRVTKGVGPDGAAVCYVNILNKTSTLSPEARETYMETHPQKVDPMREDNTGDVERFKVADEPIEDIRFLGDEAYKLCKDHETFWVYPDKYQMTPDGPQDKTDAVSRRRRASFVPTVANACPKNGYPYNWIYCVEYQNRCYVRCFRYCIQYRRFESGQWKSYIYCWAGEVYWRVYNNCQCQ